MMYATAPSAGLSARGVTKYNDFGLLKATCRKRCKIGGKLVIITKRKSICTRISDLNDVEWRNGPYFALFHRIRHRKTVMRPTSVSESTFDSL